MSTNDLDLQILQYLEKDSRTSLRNIAEELNVSPTTVSNRVHKMQEEGLVTKFSVKLDLAKLGYEMTAIIKIKAKGDDLTAVLQSLEGYSHLTHIYEITGDFDILAIAKFANREQMNDEIKNLLHNSVIDETNTSVVLSTIKEYENSELI